MDAHQDLLILQELGPDDSENIMQFMNDYFFSRLLFFKTWGGTVEDMIRGVSVVLQEALENGVCIGIKEIKDPSRLIALRVCSILERNKEVIEWANVQPTEKGQHVRVILQSVPSPETLFRDPFVKKILYSRFVSVHPNYSGRNLSMILFEECIKAGAAAGCQMFYCKIGNDKLKEKMFKSGCKVLEWPEDKSNPETTDQQDAVDDVIPKTESVLCAMYKVLKHRPRDNQIRSSL